MRINIKLTKIIFAVVLVFFILPTKGQHLVLEKKRKHSLVDTIISIVKPDSIHIKGRNYQIYDSTVTLTRFAIGGSFNVGTAIFQRNLSKHFTNPYYFSLQLNLHFNKFILQFDDYVGFCRTRQTMLFDSLQWKKNTTSASIALGLNLGYSFFERKKITISLITGFGTNRMRSIKNSDNYKKEHSLPYYKIGFHVDFKNIALTEDHIRINDKDVYYSSLRVSFGFNSPTGTPRYSEYFSGSMFYISIGTGVIQRGYCSPDQCRF